MALLMKLQNVVTNKGKLVYRRRIPSDLRHLYPITFFETRFREQSEGPKLVSEHAALEAAFTRMTEDARAGEPEAVGRKGVQRYISSAWSQVDDPRTERERWAALRDEAETLVRSVRGLGGPDRHGDGGDEARREIVAEEIERTGGDPLLYRAVVQPKSAPPPVTLADAAKVYEMEKLGQNPSRSAKNTFNKI